MLGKNLVKAAAGNVGSGPFIEELFSTYLYTGNGSTQTITNGIDLAGEGGLVWTKDRSVGYSHALVDTERGRAFNIKSNSTTGNSTASPLNNDVTSFGNSGYGLGPDFNGNFNTNGTTFVSWTFRKAPGFFDVVTYTGNGSNRTIAHNLGSVPGTIIVKRTDTAADWQVYHRNLANTEYMVLNSTAAKATGTTRWNSTTPTSSVFSLGTDASVNASGGTYVAYLFAHDEQIFGESGDQSVIKCGSYTGTGSNGNFINLGWEPQYLLVKGANVTSGWTVVDNMRGLTVGDDAILNANNSSSEAGLGSPYNVFDPASTGFIANGSFGNTNASGYTYIYIAIRRGPMKKPTSGTEVFSVLTASNAQGTKNVTDFAVDLQWANAYQAGTGFYSMAKLAGVSTTGTTGGRFLSLFSANAEADGTLTQFWDNTGFQTPSFFAIAPTVYCSFRRAPGFFDVVAYTGTGSARTVSHNLGAVPELMLVKSRSANAYWRWYWAPLGATKNFYMPNDEASVTQTEIWNNTAPTSSAFTVGTSTDTNFSGRTYIAYLFATCPGVSKVGSYTGTGTTLNIDCGFTSGSRLVLIKRTDSTGDWYIWNTARGIVAANDPFLLLNFTAAENSLTDYIDPLSSGFQISSTAPAAINANGGSYIFLAIS